MGLWRRERKVEWWEHAALVPPALADEFADLVPVVTKPCRLPPSIGTGGFSPCAAGNGSGESARVLAEVIGQQGRELIQRLVATYGLCWPWFVATTFQAEEPDLYVGVEEAFEAGRITGSSVAYNALMYAAMDAQVLFWGGWQAPVDVACRLCSRRFPAMEVGPRVAGVGLGYSYCGVCLARSHEWGQLGVRDPLNASEFADDEMSARLRRQADVLGYPPARDTRAELQFHLIEPQVADRIVCAFMTSPAPAAYLERFGRPWTRVLIATGVVTGARVTKRGTMSIAREGHFCRSMAERIVDDYLDTHGIAHEPEPPWPAHPQLNPKRMKRADWVLADGTFVEYAGLTGNPVYDAEMVKKAELARSCAIPLIVLLPHHLRDLDAVFAAYRSRPC